VTRVPKNLTLDEQVLEEFLTLAEGQPWYTNFSRFVEGCMLDVIKHGGPPETEEEARRRWLDND
jgi:hypothetical protein